MAEKDLMEGGVGQVLLMVSIVILLVGEFTPYYYYTSYYYTYILATIAAYSIFIAFATLFMTSMRKVARRFGGSSVGTVGAVFGLVTGIGGIILSASLLTDIPDLYYLYYDIGWLVFDVFMGLTMVLIGASCMAHSEHFSPSGLWTATGAIYIVAGALDFTTSLTSMLLGIGALLILIAYVIMITAGILGGVCFFVSRTAGKLGTLQREQHPTPKQMKFCLRCGTALPEDSVFCAKCGAKRR